MAKFKIKDEVLGVDHNYKVKKFVIGAVLEVEGAVFYAATQDEMLNVHNRYKEGEIFKTDKEASKYLTELIEEDVAQYKKELMERVKAKNV